MCKPPESSSRQLARGVRSAFWLPGWEMPPQPGLLYPAVRREIKVLSCPFLASVATPASSLSTHRCAKHHQPSPALQFSFLKKDFLGLGK